MKILSLMLIFSSIAILLVHGSMDVAFRNPEKYNPVASMAGLLDMMVELPLWVLLVLSESPQSSPPSIYI